MKKLENIPLIFSSTPINLGIAGSTHLASIMSEEEDAIIDGMVGGDDAWIGMSRQKAELCGKSSKYGLTCSNWTWSGTSTTTSSSFS